MASYEHKNHETWILEKGTYKIILGKNVREHIDTFDYIQAEDKIMKYDNKTGVEITNKFDDVYENPELMDKFLDQLTVNEMVMMVIDGGYGTRGVERLITVKMHTKAFQEPYEYDSSLAGALLKPDEWEFEEPYTLSNIEYLLNNVLNTIIFVVRHIL